VSKKRNSLQKLIEEIEEKLEKYSLRKNELEALLADPDTYNDPQKGSEFNKEYLKLEERISRLEVEWENNHLKLEELLKTLEG